MWGYRPHNHKLEGGEAVGVGCNLGDEPEGLGDFPGSGILQVSALQQNRAFPKAEDSCQGPEKGGLTRPVWAYQPNELTTLGVQVHVGQEGFCVDLVGEGLSADC